MQGHEHRAWPDSPLAPTPLREARRLADRLGLSAVHLKLESERPFGNFKFLGGFAATVDLLAQTGECREVVCASDGNHGLAVAAGARRAGAAATVFLPEDVDPVRAAGIGAQGATVVRVEGTYDHAVARAREHSAATGALLMADTGGDPDDPTVARVVAGYGTLVAELVARFETLGSFPTHAFVQAGVGGLAAAIADGLLHRMDGPRAMTIVEPASAACVAAALAAGRPVEVPGRLRTSASMLSCGLASAGALRTLLRHRPATVQVGEDDLAEAAEALALEGVPTTASGAAGLAGLMAVCRSPATRDGHRLDPRSRALVVVTEGPSKAD